MFIKTYITKCLIFICILLADMNLLYASEPNENSIKIFQYLSVPPSFENSDKRSLAKGLNFQDWPKTNIWRIAPDINKSMLTYPEKITKEHKFYDITQFGQDYWGSCHWSADNITENDQSTSKELPEERKKELLKGVSPELSKDPNFVKKYTDGISKKYEEIHKYKRSGSIKVTIYNTPNSSAANELLLRLMSTTQMPLSTILKMHSNADKIADLGTLNYVLKDRNDNVKRIEFIRDNIVVLIKIDGILSGEALQLAKSIDSAIVKGPVLTYEQLIARRPGISISSNTKKEKGTNLKKINYNIIKPNDVNIVDKKAVIRGEMQEVKNGIDLPETNGPAGIKLFVITNELLVGQCERTVDIPDSNE